MLGAIIGDIVGSAYEWDNINAKVFPLFSKHSFFTDDTVMTIAVADALMNGGTAKNFINSMKFFEGFTLTLVTVIDLNVGSFPIHASRTTVGATARQCAFPPAGGLQSRSKKRKTLPKDQRQ